MNTRYAHSQNYGINNVPTMCEDKGYESLPYFWMMEEQLAFAKEQFAKQNICLNIIGADCFTFQFNLVNDNYAAYLDDLEDISNINGALNVYLVDEIFSNDLNQTQVQYSSNYPTSSNGEVGRTSVMISIGDELYRRQQTGPHRGKALAHELGHAMGLHHTYFGTYPNASSPAYACAETLTNGDVCGDLILDTPPDNRSTNYNASTCSWNTGSNNPADLTNIMSAFSDKCREAFSLGQGQRMKLMLENLSTHANVFTKKSVCECDGQALGGAKRYSSLENGNIYTGSITFNRAQIIPEGVTITFRNANIVFKPSAVVCNDKGFIVLPGGKLILDNTTIVGVSGTQWDGIKVFGDASEPVDINAASIPHGVVEMTRTTIQNARVGIHSINGGIVSAAQSQFVNNEVGIKAEDKFDAAILLNRCQFETNNSYPKANPTAQDMKAFIDLRSARASVLGCTFTNLNTNYDEERYFGTGILAYRSDVRVEPYTPSQNPNSKIVNEFAGLYKGIDYYSVAAGLGVNLYADENTFTNVTKCITTNGGIMHEIKNNTMTLAPPRGNGIIELLGQYGVYCIGGRDNVVTANTITGNVANALGGFGIVNRHVVGTGSVVGVTGTIYGNTISETFTATQGEGTNDATLVNCNDYRQNNSLGHRTTWATLTVNGNTFLVDGRQRQIGDCIVQGQELEELPAGNVFDACLNVADQLQDASGFGFEYNYHSTNSEAPEQNCVSISVIIQPCLNGIPDNKCLSLDHPSNNLPEAVLRQRMNNAPTQEERERFRNRLLRKYAVLDRISDAEQLIRNETALSVRKLRVAQALDNKDFSGCQQELDAIPLDGTEETEQFKVLYQQLVNVCRDRRKLNQINPTERAVIEQVAQSKTASRTEAEAILALLDDTPIERIPEKPSNGNQMAREVDNTDIGVEGVDMQVFPNPASSILSVQLFGELIEGKISLFDIASGKKVLEKEVERNGSTNYNLNLNEIADGVYMLQWHNDIAVVKRVKVVVIK